MSVNLRLSGHDPEPHETGIGSARSVSQAFDWMRSLPKGKYPLVDEFAANNKVSPTDSFFDQLLDASIEQPPPSDGTDDMVDLLMERVGAGRPGETVEIMFGD